MRTITFLAALLITPTLVAVQAHAQDEPAAEEGEEEEGPKDGYIYDLDKIGVNVALVPKGDWKHDHWSGWDLKAANESAAVEVIVWTTEFQQSIEEAELESWGEVFTTKAAERLVVETSLGESSVQPDVHGQTAGMFKVDGKSKDDDPVVMYGASIPIEGQVLHVATLSLAAKGAAAKEARDAIVENLEIRKPPAELSWGGKHEVPEQLTATTDPYWRPALKVEREALNRNIKAVGQSLRGCWAAVHPHPPAKTDLLLVCHDKKHSFPVVNERTFSDQEAELREAWLGDAEAGQKLQAQGRMGFMWNTTVGKRQLAIMALPMEGGLMKATAITGGGDHAKVTAAAQSTVDSASFAPPKEPPFDEYFRYLVAYEPMSPLIIGPAVAAALLLLIIFGIIIFGLRRQAAQARAEMEEI